MVKCINKKQFLLLLLLLLCVNLTNSRGGGRGRSSSSRSRSRGGGNSGGGGSGSSGGFFSRLFGGGGSKSTSVSKTHTGTGSYPMQPPHITGKNYNSGQSHFYNSPHSPSTNWHGTSSYSNPLYHQSQNTFGNFHPVSSGVAPSYHFARSTSYVPIYIPSHHTYYHSHHHHTNNGQSSSTTNNNPPPPPSEPVVYKEASSSGESKADTIIIGFNNMIVYGIYENEKHYVITVSEDLDEDANDIPEKFLQREENNLFDIVTLKPPTTSTTAQPMTDVTFGFQDPNTDNNDVMKASTQSNM